MSISSLLEIYGGNEFLISCKDSSLRPLGSSHVSESYLNWLNEPELNRFSSRAGKIFTIDDVSDYINVANKSSDILLLGIFLNENEKHVGNIQLRYFDKRNRLAEIATLLGDKDYWGKGIIVEAARNLIHFGFQELNVHKFIMGNISPNRASTFKSTSLGAKLEGTRHAHVLFEGEYVDVLEFGLLKGDFYNRFAEMENV